jgi:hypothetical protein
MRGMILSSKEIQTLENAGWEFVTNFIPPLSWKPSWPSEGQYEILVEGMRQHERSDNSLQSSLWRRKLSR